MRNSIRALSLNGPQLHNSMTAIEKIPAARISGPVLAQMQLPADGKRKPRPTG